jgi:hypothetical protein
MISTSAPRHTGSLQADALLAAWAEHAGDWLDLELVLPGDHAQGKRVSRLDLSGPLLESLTGKF